MRFNARRSLSVSLEVRPELLRLLEVFPYFENSTLVLDMLALEKPSSSAGLVTEAPAIRVPAICLFSNSVRLVTHLNEISVKHEKELQIYS